MKNEAKLRSMKKELFIIYSNLKNMISKDKKRSLKDKIEDLKFLEDQEGERKLVIGSDNNKYKKKVFNAFN